MDDALFCLNLFQGTLCRKIYPAFHIKLQEIYRKAATTRILLPDPLVLEEKDKDGKVKRVEVAQYREPALPKDFQLALKEVHLWNHYQIEELFTSVCAGERPVIDNCIEAVFAYATKLACASANIPPHLVSVSIPDSSHFIHAVLVEVCRRIYECPWIIHTKGIAAYQRYQMQLEPLVQKATITQIERMLPTANILHNLNYGSENAAAQAEADDAEAAHIAHEELTNFHQSPLDLKRVDLNYQLPATASIPFAQPPPFAAANENSSIPMGTTTTVTTVTGNQPTALAPVITNPLVTEIHDSDEDENEEEDEEEENNSGDENTKTQETGAKEVTLHFDSKKDGNNQTAAPSIPIQSPERKQLPISVDY